MAPLLSLLLVAASLLVTSPLTADAVGLCSNTTFTSVMQGNNCPTNVLKTLYSSLGPRLVYRVMPAARAQLIKCATATISEPDRNVLTITNTYSYNDISIADTVVSFNLADSECGLVFKYNFDNSYEMYKLAVVTLNNLTLGYHECSSEPGFYTQGEVFAECLTPQEDSEEVTASVEACRQALATATGATDLVVVPYCTNAEDEPSTLVEIAETVSELFSTGGLINIIEDED